ncbi:MAG: hypothetical protein SRB1_02379 [Desulfobacteraceae bacterium Eth-SRB1]|nr:MAG: hypothetical protein SRB1_02379 [Desulfobacteraceae bacterium Eth-SRB1]
MYQLEVKKYLIENMFHPKNGWNVLVDIDAMEKGKGNQQKPEKIERAKIAEKGIIGLGAKIGTHPIYGRVDVVASHPKYGVYIIEAEGKSSKQKDLAIYSALGQVIRQMERNESNLTFAIAVPDQKKWEFQISKIPNRVKDILKMECFLVSEHGVRRI